MISRTVLSASLLLVGAFFWNPRPLHNSIQIIGPSPISLFPPKLPQSALLHLLSLSLRSWSPLPLSPALHMARSRPWSPGSPPSVPSHIIPWGLSVRQSIEAHEHRFLWRGSNGIREAHGLYGGRTGRGKWMRWGLWCKSPRKGAPPRRCD